MKTKLLKTWLMLVCLLVGVGSAWAETVTYTFSDVASEKSWENGIAQTNVSLGNFTFTVSGGGNNGKYYTSDVTWRFYSGGGLTITPATGYSISSVTSDPSQTFSVLNGVASTSFSATVKIKSITIEYTTSGGSTTTKYGISADPTGLGETGNGFSVNGTYYNSYQYIRNAAAAGETVTLTASTNTGYKATADCWNVLQGTTPVAVSGSGNNYSFTMPAGDVSISPVYVAESTPQEPTKLTKPTNLSANNITATSADLSWDAVTNASSYKVTVYDDEFNSLADNVTVNATTYSVSGLTAETHYNWYVTAVGDGVNYSNSDAKC